MSNWLSASASIIGTGHAASGTPCQDSHCCIQRDDGRWLAMTVSDGAGTARYSDKGAGLVAKSFAHALIELSNQIEHREPGAWINDFVIGHILTIRNELRSLAKSDNLKEYHCTLVACLLGETGGLLIHIGDGAAFGGVAKDIDKAKCLISELSFASLPENGEYSNETFFITEGDWIKHLRITPIANADWIILATDGATALAMVADKDPKSGFIVPLLTSLVLEEDSDLRNAKLAAVLGDRQADRLTGDDKTICLAYRKSLGSQKKQFVMESPVITQTPHKAPVVGSSTITATTEGVVQAVQRTWNKRINWKIQITRKVIVTAVAMITAIAIACWAFLRP